MGKEVTPWVGSTGSRPGGKGGDRGGGREVTEEVESRTLPGLWGATRARGASSGYTTDVFLMDRTRVYYQPTDDGVFILLHEAR